jgi:hypothetical protein
MPLGADGFQRQIHKFGWELVAFAARQISRGVVDLNDKIGEVDHPGGGGGVELIENNRKS